MRQIIIKANEKERRIDIPDESKILLNWSNILEISFLCLHNRDEEFKQILKELYENILTIEKSQIKEIVIAISDVQEVSFKVPILAIVYRTVDYMAGMSFKNEEVLSIKFAPDQDFIVSYTEGNERIFCCDFKKCRYLKNGYCMKYEEQLSSYLNSYKVCEQCFTTVRGIFADKEIRQEYEKMKETE